MNKALYCSFSFKFIYIYFERKSMSRGGAETERERGGGRESQADSTLSCAEPDMGFEPMNHETVTRI